MVSGFCFGLVAFAAVVRAMVERRRARAVRAVLFFMMVFLFLFWLIWFRVRSVFLFGVRGCG